ncbi:MAG: thiamine pyrophosphate-requiring protein [Caldilineaceae bacterium]|nr:thiamine pyrophosphate-requiring protein [Caldilineaceae bacterium]
MEVHDAIISILAREGEGQLFCFPDNPLIEAAARNGMRPIMTRTERTAVAMADGYTRVSNGRRTGVCTVQAGAGVENSFAGVAQANADSVPLLFLPGHIGRDRHGSTRNFPAVPSYRPITKWAEQVNMPGRMPEMMRRAFSYLRNGRPGPVMLEIPRDVGNSEIDDGFEYRPPQRVRAAGDPEAVDAVIAALLKAKCPVIQVGQGVLYAEATEELQAFAELTGAPVMSTLLGKSAFAEDHPLSIGAVANDRSVTRAIAHYLDKADLILGIGCSLSLEWMRAPVPPGKTIIQVTNDDRDLNADMQIDIGVLGDAKLVLYQLTEALQRQTGGSGRDQGNVVQEIEKIRRAWFEEWGPLLTSDEAPINPYRVIWDLMHTVDRTQTIVTHDSGYVRDQVVPFFEAIVPRGYLGWGNSTQMGHSLGLALGAKVAAPEKTVVNIMGDASFGMLGLEIETAARNELPILTIILNNSVMCGSEAQMPTAVERFGLKQLSGDYAKIAEGLGAVSERVESPQEVVPAIRRAQQVMSTGRPALIEVITKEEQRLPRLV